MADIYEQHRTTFANTKALVIMQGADRVATVAFKIGGAVTCYFHLFGTRMQNGRATGGGYDRQSAAVESAVAKLTGTDGTSEAQRAHLDKIRAALKDDSGLDWTRRLEDVGYKVWQVV